MSEEAGTWRQEGGNQTIGRIRYIQYGDGESFRSSLQQYVALNLCFACICLKSFSPAPLCYLVLSFISNDMLCNMGAGHVSKSSADLASLNQTFHHHLRIGKSKPSETQSTSTQQILANLPSLKLTQQVCPWKFDGTGRWIRLRARHLVRCLKTVSFKEGSWMILEPSNISNQVPNMALLEGIPAYLLVSRKICPYSLHGHHPQESDRLGHVGRLRLEGPLEAL